MIRAIALILSIAGGAVSAETGPQSSPLTISGSKGDLILGPGDMTDARAEVYGSEADMTITLSAAAGAKLGDFTANHLGEEIAVLSCGKVIFRPQIIEAIRGGQLTIGGLTLDQAQGLADVVLGQAPCPAGP